MLLFSVFGGLSIGLTVIGIAGLIISTVNWRRREIGVRLALGAQTRDVVSLIAMQGAKLIGRRRRTGCAVVVAGVAAALEPAVRCRGHGCANVWSAAAAVLGLAVPRVLCPARRAARLDPCRIFREE